MVKSEACKWLANLKNDIGNPHYECLWTYAQAIDEIINGLEDGTLLKEQQDIVPCKDCGWYDERISMCDNCGLPREQTFFCADGKRK